MSIINPYKDINWGNQQKANFHTHTKQITINDVLYGSDGSLTQQEVIDDYYGKGYKILALTDHDYDHVSQVTTHPWSIFGRDPATLGMLAIEGKELSAQNHIGSLFNDIGHTGGSETESILAIANNSGLAIIHHPGRYTETIQWYVDLFTTHAETLIGLEVYNQGNRYPNDRKTWDLINALTIPQGKIVYGYSNDDMHLLAHRFRNYQFILSDTIAESDVRTAMEGGKTYFCYESGGSGDALAPRISNIVVDETAETITVVADSGTISWVTEGTIEVGTGATFDYTSLDKTFVRAVITNASGITYTQPFVFYTPTFANLETKVRHNGAWVEPEIKTWNNGLWVEAEPKI